MLYDGYINKAGQHVDPVTAIQVCAPSGNADFQAGSSFTACIHAHGWLSTIIWQPASRYWLFQGIESGILVALALGLLALSIWWAHGGSASAQGPQATAGSGTQRRTGARSPGACAAAQRAERACAAALLE